MIIPVFPLFQAARSAGGYAALEPRRLCPLGQAPRQKTPFSFSKKSRRGKLQKNMQRVFLAGRSTACRARRRGLVQHFVLK